MALSEDIYRLAYRIDRDAEIMSYPVLLESVHWLCRQVAQFKETSELELFKTRDRLIREKALDEAIFAVRREIINCACILKMEKDSCESCKACGRLEEKLLALRDSISVSRSEA